jgi:hypothetical protein
MGLGTSDTLTRFSFDVDANGQIFYGYKEVPSGDWAVVSL